MWIRPSDLVDNLELRFLLHVFLRIHSFVWRGRMRVSRCEMIYKVHIRGNQITVYHDADSPLYKTVATWTRMKIPHDPESDPIIVYITQWPPDEILR